MCRRIRTVAKFSKVKRIESKKIKGVSDLITSLISITFLIIVLIICVSAISDIQVKNSLDSIITQEILLVESRGYLTEAEAKIFRDALISYQLQDIKIRIGSVSKSTSTWKITTITETGGISGHMIERANKADYGQKFFIEVSAGFSGVMSRLANSFWTATDDPYKVNITKISTCKQ
jgi:hypothetical protein